MFSAAEKIRYQRHFSLPQIGKNGQQLLKKARVLCVGAGGLGNPLTLYLTAAGVGNIGIIDDDHVELSNIHRQVLFSEKEVGKPKVTVLKQKLTELNPNVNIIAHDERLTKNNALKIIKQYDIIADGTDNFATRYLINDACFQLQKPNVFASVFQFEGQAATFIPKITPCYRCLFPNPPPLGLIPNCAEGGILGVLPGIMGCIQATEVIKLITKIGDPLLNRLLIFDALKMQFREFKIASNKKCLLCSKKQKTAKLPNYEDYPGAHSCTTDQNSITVKEFKELLAAHKKITILDVRSAKEYKIFNLGGKLIPLDQLENRLHELKPNDFIVVYCQSGGRSKIAVELLKKYGFKNVFNLIGGIEAIKKSRI